MRKWSQYSLSTPSEKNGIITCEDNERNKKQVDVWKSVAKKTILIAHHLKVRFYIHIIHMKQIYIAKVAAQKILFPNYNTE